MFLIIAKVPYLSGVRCWTDTNTYLQLTEEGPHQFRWIYSDPKIIKAMPRGHRIIGVGWKRLLLKQVPYNR